MSEKTFLVTMDDTKFCDLREYGECTGIFYCEKCHYKKCIGNLKARPEWCPIVEVQHSDQVPTSTLFKNVWLEI